MENLIRLLFTNYQEKTSKDRLWLRSFFSPFIISIPFIYFSIIRRTRRRKKWNCTNENPIIIYELSRKDIERQTLVSIFLLSLYYFHILHLSFHRCSFHHSKNKKKIEMIRLLFINYQRKDIERQTSKNKLASIFLSF